MAEIFVESEFAPLRTVVLAQSEICFAANILDDPNMRFLPDDPERNLEPGKNFAECDPKGQSAWEAERTALQFMLERYGVEVLRPRTLTEPEKAAGGSDGYANFFVRDPFFTVGNVVVESSLRFPLRRREVLPVREIIRSRVMPADCLYVAAPMPEVADSEDHTLGAGPFLEGGDVLIIGKHVFVGHSGLTSNPAGAAWLAKLLKPQGYSVEVVRLHPDILHLDCALSLVRDGLMIICEDAFIEGVPEHLKSWARVTVTLEEASLLATNGLPVSPEVYITDPAFSHIGDQLERRGTTVEYVDYRISRSLGGSFRCSTQPLWRA